jgi:four helix bundle protein
MKASRFWEPEVFGAAYKHAMEIFEIGKTFPVEEKYSLTDQIRRASRSVCTNTAEGWRKRRFFPKHFVSKLSDADAEAAETQVWLKFARDSEHVTYDKYAELFDAYDKIQAQLVLMMKNAEDWCSDVGNRGNAEDEAVSWERVKFVRRGECGVGRETVAPHAKRHTPYALRR